MARVITAIVVLPILIASIWFSNLSPLFVALAVAAMILGLYEFWALAKRRGMKPDVTVGMIAAAALLVVFYFNAPDLILVMIAAFTIATLAAAVRRGAPFDQMMASAGATVLGLLYVVVLGGHLVAVRTLRPFADCGNCAAKLLSFFFLVLMGADTAAYYTGRAFGRHKLAPAVSPGKTWEGAAGGMAASLGAAALAHFWFFPELRLTAALPLSAVMNVLGVVGDLTESAIKRGA